jgi:hypothetical protein
MEISGNIYAFLWTNKFKSYVNTVKKNSVLHLVDPSVSVNVITSDLSFVTYKGETPMSAFPLITSAIIPLADPLTDLEPGESTSWSTELLMC